MDISAYNFTARSTPQALGFAKLRQSQQSAVAASTEPADTFVKREPVKVYILDNFWNSENSTTHGELVEAELVRRQVTEGDNATINLERKHVDNWTGPSGIKEGKPGALEGHIRRHFVVRLNNDADAFAEILDASHGRAVIHQSQGSSQSRVTQGIYHNARNDEEYRIQLQKQLGLEPTEHFNDPERKELLTSLLAETDRIHKTDPEVQEAIEELRILQDGTHDKGHVHVISAGNQGGLSRELERLGVDEPEGFYRNEMASPKTIIVGASDDQSKEADSGNEHTVSHQASPGAGALIGADGVDRPLFVDGKLRHSSGSSYAAPQSSSLVIDMLREDPDISYDSVINNLTQRATPVEGAAKFLGHGWVTSN